MNDTSASAVVDRPSADPLSPAHVAIDPVFEERWAAWRARGLRHDAVVRRRMRLVAVIAAIAFALVTLAFVLTGGSP